MKAIQISKRNWKVLSELKKMYKLSMFNDVITNLLDDYEENQKQELQYEEPEKEIKPSTEKLFYPTIPTEQLRERISLTFINGNRCPKCGYRIRETTRNKFMCENCGSKFIYTGDIE
jgi:DNA-directed RNA polymerase subunit RPC12/RpoP